MFANHIQSMIENAVKALIREGGHKRNLYMKPYMNKIDMLCNPKAINFLKFNQFDEKGNPK